MRTSHACLSCAKRKRGCDLTKPTCKRCQKLKIECQWPVRDRFLHGAQQYGRHRVGGGGSGIESLASAYSFAIDVVDPLAYRHPAEMNAENAHNQPPGAPYDAGGSFPGRFQPQGLAYTGTKRVEDVLVNNGKGGSGGSVSVARRGRESNASRTAALAFSAASQFAAMHGDSSHAIRGADFEIAAATYDAAQAVPQVGEEEFEYLVDVEGSYVQPLLHSDSFAHVEELDGEQAEHGSQFTWPSTEPTLAEQCREPVLQAPRVKELSYVKLFLDYFCRDGAATMLLGGSRAWRSQISRLMETSDGVSNAVMAVSSAFALRTYATREAQADFLHYYGAGVRAVQSRLEMNDFESPSTIIGVALFLLCETIRGDRTAYEAHRRAVQIMILRAGPKRCAQDPLLRSVFSTALGPIMASSLLLCHDCPLADVDWQELIVSLWPNLPTLTSMLCLYAQVLRCCAKERKFAIEAAARTARLLDEHAEQDVRASPVLRREEAARHENRLLALALHAALAKMETTWRRQLQEVDPYQFESLIALAHSPIQPSYRLEEGWLLNVAPRVLCYRLRLEQIFSLANDRHLQDTLDIIRIAQYVVHSSHDSGPLLMQIVPLEVVRSFIGLEMQPEWEAWIGDLRSIIAHKGFELGTFS